MLINTNINALISVNNLRVSENGITSQLKKLSSGLRINSGADDPSGLAISMKMGSQISGMRQAVLNAEDGISMIRLADGALQATSDALNRMRDLAVRASNDAILTAEDSNRLNNEFIALSAEISRKATTVTFNTKVLFSGGFAGGLVLQIGQDNSTNFRLSVVIPAMTTAGLGISTATVSTLAQAQAAIDLVNSAINIVSDTRASLGIQERRLGYIIDDLKVSDINVSAAKSRIMDADMATEVTELTRVQILQQSGMSILGQANNMPQSVLKLLQ